MKESSMGRLSIQEILNEGLVCCPVCRESLALSRDGEHQLARCVKCSQDFPVIDDVPSLLPPKETQNGVKRDIQAFWKELYKEAYSRHDEKLDKAEFAALIKELEALFDHRQHLATTEMPLSELPGKRVLEIGPGAGAHSALFSTKGAKMVSMDITLDRALATARKYELIDSNPNNACVQGDAENLPFPDNTFDIVYSNGVLHHTPDTPKTIREVHRVLKPGGRAIIMLYARHSFFYWANIFLVRGVLMGNIFRSKDWLGRTTEWMAAGKKQRVYNPETKVYSKKEILEIFAPFQDVKVRKNSFAFNQIPALGRVMSRALGKFTGYNRAGTLVYGFPWRKETKLELSLGGAIGFGLNISAVKR